MNHNPTIVGIATGTPDGGVSVVRISGPQAGPIAVELLGKLPKPRRLTFARLALKSRAPEEALVAWMPGPASFTGEDVVELHVHAGLANTREVTEAILAHGAVAAGPGEFSRQAFANGKLSLDQAEGIAALIGAQTQAALHQARRLVAGELGRAVDELRTNVWQLLCEVEANLDFPEDVDTNDQQRWHAELTEFETTLKAWGRRFEQGRRARECARFVLAGPPNAGKSALFNRLIGRGRSIVSDTPGTTRDYVEATLELGPHRATLVDTAGVRSHGADAIEVEGIDRSHEQISGADLVIWVESATEADGAQPNLEGVEVLRVENKRDLGQTRDRWIGVSASTGHGCDRLLAKLEGWFASDGIDPWIGLARHRDRAHDALEAVVEAKQLLQDNAGLELVAFSIDVVRRRLDEITGRSDVGPVGTEVLHAIFGQFCIGK